MHDSTYPPAEVWRPVPNTSRRYSVSSQGRLRREEYQRPSKYWWATSRVEPVRLLTLGVDRDGYRRAVVHFNDGRRPVYVHRLVLEAFVGPCPDGMEACHNNGVQDDNRVENLRWDTHLSNIIDRDTHAVHYQKAKTHCPRGHALVPPNLVKKRWERDGYRTCLACDRGKGNVKTDPSRDMQVESDRHYVAIMGDSTHDLRR